MIPFQTLCSLMAIVFGLLCFTPKLMAQTPEESQQDPSEDLIDETPVSSPSSENRAYWIGFSASNYDYREPNLMQVKGYMAGVNAGYAHKLSETDVLQAQGGLHGGSLYYSGALQDEQGGKTPYETSGDKYSMVDFSGLYKGLTNWTENFHTLAFVGIGLRYTLDIKDNVYDYERQITHWYVPFGVEFQLPVTEQLDVGAVVELDFMLRGSTDTKLGEINSRYNNVKFRQNAGSGYRLGVNATYALADQRALLFDFSFRKWSVAKSPAEYVGLDEFGKELYGIEPQNETETWMATVGFAFL